MLYGFNRDHMSPNWKRSCRCSVVAQHLNSSYSTCLHFPSPPQKRFATTMTTHDSDAAPELMRRALLLIKVARERGYDSAPQRWPAVAKPEGMRALVVCEAVSRNDAVD